MAVIEIKAPYEYGSDITVQILDQDGELIECNHAGATEEEVDYGHACYEHADWHDDIRMAMVCDKPNCENIEEIEQEEPDYE